ncbi:AAA family ATPase [Streptomyces sp. NPDC007905]|uniref:AAA family ATPase n=1 Tax=Streptomyces sp. NPDC007905 TaxID=3364788 RepID=UPI0036F0BD27
MSESSSARELTSRDILNLLKDPALGAVLPDPDDISPQRWMLREKTALLGAFDAAELEVQESEDSAEAKALREFLTRDCDRVHTRRGRRWRPVPAVRTATLERLRTRDNLLTALRSGVPAGHDTARDCAEQLLTGTAPALADRGAEELHALLTLVRWFDDAPNARAALAEQAVPLPDPDELVRHIELARLLEPLETLADPMFCGREAELDELARHIDPVKGNHRWLMIHGPGGVGKSTLVARFALDHITRAEPARKLLFVYLPFDRTDLVPQQPLTLLGEALRQLRVLLPGLEGRAARELEQAVRTTLNADARAESEQQGSKGPRSGRAHDERSLAQLFSHLVTRALPDTNRPILLFLDTFERAQHIGSFAIARLVDFLEVLQNACPPLHIVAAGRAPADSRRFTDLPLEGFDPTTARAFLRRLLPGDGPEYEAAVHTITQTVGSDPLSLKLAADLFRRQGPRALHDPALRRLVQLRLQPEERQGVLYRRILDHLENPQLRSIASPGLTVRRVTPDVIRRVLAAPCGLGRIDERRARVLFHQLRDEAALVADVPGQEAVVHRTDVRRVMLPMLRGDAGEVVNRIHRRAINYYARQSEIDPANAAEHRAEELYHRLSLGQAPKTLDRRWLPEIGPLLNSAMEELPARSQVYLSERLGLTVGPDLLRQADDETWGRQALRTATVRLADGQADQVLTLLDQRPDHVNQDAGLSTVRIRALAAAGRTDEARALVEPALELASRACNTEAFVDIAVCGARVEEDLGRFRAARSLLGQAREAAKSSGPAEVPLLTVAVADLRLYRREDRADTPDAALLRTEVVDRVARLGRHERARHPALVRELAAEVGDHLPELVSETARLLGLDIEGAAGHVLRASLSDDEVRDLEEVTRAGRKNARGPSDPGTVIQDADDWWVVQNTAVRGDRVGEYVDSDAQHRLSWNHALVNTYQYEVDQAQFTRSGSSRRPHAPHPRHEPTVDAVVVVPGFMGSVLVDAHSGERLWGHEPSKWLPRAWMRGGVDALRLTDDERAGDHRRVRPVSLLSTPAWAPMLGALEPYGRLLDRIRDHVAHPDAVLEFPYDWRLPAAHNARLLAQAAGKHLERWRAHPAVPQARWSLADDPEPRLVIIAHSLGGVVTCAALNQDAWLAENTRTVVCLGTPFRGVPRAVEMLSSQPQSEPMPVPYRRMRDLMRTLPGFYDLLPDYRCVENNGGLRHLELSDVHQLGGDTALAAEAMHTRQTTDVAALLPRIHAVVGVGQRTVQSVDLAHDKVRTLETMPRLSSEGTPVLDAQGTPLRWDAGGDGLVPRVSASSPTRADCFVEVRNGSLIAEHEVMTYVGALLSEDDYLGIEPPSPALAGGGIGLPSRDGISLSLPEVVEAGEPCEIQVRGALTPARVRCTFITDGNLSADTRVRPHPDGDDLWAQLTFPLPGPYRVTVEDGEQSASRLVFVMSSEDSRALAEGRR